MANKFWLIQRGTFNSDLSKVTSFLSGKSDALINPDYMGAAEFKWGAVPKAYRRIMGQFDQYSLHITDLVTTGGVPFCLYCRNDRYEKILEAIKAYLNEKYQLKEWSNMHAHFTEPSPDEGEWSKNHRKYELKTNFWWCIDMAKLENSEDPYDNMIGDWIAFVGATDRQNAFSRVIQSDYDNWWLKESDEERNSEFKDAFKRY